ncbi:MAG TPA: Hsp20/alpha crystallin family protein [Terriglobia bacterium]|nr:Hsp20/alpha crystallin family protein [Terriglobia bacterium]
MSHTQERPSQEYGARRLAGELERIFETVSAKADEFCEARGCAWSQEADDWLRAERAVIHKPEARIARDPAGFVIEIDLPDEPLSDLTVQATEEQLLITSGPGTDGREIFRLLRLPAPVEPASLTIDLIGQALQVVLRRRT